MFVLFLVCYFFMIILLFMYIVTMRRSLIFIFMLLDLIFLLLFIMFKILSEIVQLRETLLNYDKPDDLPSAIDFTDLENMLAQFHLLIQNMLHPYAYHSPEEED